MKHLKLSQLFTLVLVISLSSCDSQNNSEVINVTSNGVTTTTVVNGSITTKSTSNNGHEVIIGSGVRASELRQLGLFAEVNLLNSATVNIVYGEKQSVIVRTDDNLLEIINTEVNNQKLTISSSESYSTRVGVTVDIIVKKLDKAVVAGSGDINIKGLSGGKFIAQVTGSGDIKANGSISNVELDIQGSGSVDFARVKAKKGKASISGSGDIDIHATKSLHARVTGSGDIRYTGKPSIDSKVTGSGSVRKHNL